MNPERGVGVPYSLAAMRLWIHPSSFILHPLRGESVDTVFRDGEAGGPAERPDGVD